MALYYDSYLEDYVEVDDDDVPDFTYNIDDPTYFGGRTNS